MSPFNPDPQNRYLSPRSDSGQSRDDERVIEAEIIHDGCDDGRDQGPYGRSCGNGYGQEQFRSSRSPWNGGLHFQTIWTSGSILRRWHAQGEWMSGAMSISQHCARKWLLWPRLDRRSSPAL